jgi:hypothetical protein
MIFPWIWNVLPAGRALKAALLAVIVSSLIALLFLVVFPGIEVVLTPPPVVEALGISFNALPAHLVLNS